jgi:superfamily II DNA/RNA helicase/cold shock CspA family protein
MSSFAELGVPAALVARLNTRGIAAPFPVQTACIPDALAGRDVSGCAPTGSGKTIAFGVALVARSVAARPHRPTALVLAPTRELAAQVQGELAWIGSGARVRSTAIYGGVGYEGQRRALAKGVEIVVACPGRLEDLLTTGALSLDDVGMVVIDEADRMADMGFLPAVKRILDRIPGERQTLLFSATLDGEVDALVKRYQKHPAFHDVAGAETTATDVEHAFWRVTAAGRVPLAAQVVAARGRTVIFCRTKHAADRVARQLGPFGVRAVALHGDRTQSQRDRAIAAFIDGKADCLVATDVAARGIHVDDVACVVHFDPPADAKDYVHRSGRTGRAGARGAVVTFVTDEKKKDVHVLQRALRVEQRVIAPPRLDQQAPEPEPAPVVPARTRAPKPAPAPAPASAPEPEIPFGVVKFYDAKKGFGFIAREGETDLFVHSTAVEAAGLRRLETGQRIAFELEPGRSGEEAHQLQLLA